MRVFTDSDWAGDPASRKSTSGGGVTHGTHLLSHWSRTQQSIALSSCEAELNALCKAGQEGLVAIHLASETGLNLDLEIYTDSSAAKGVIQRRGAGKVKHLEVKQLWLQEREERKELQVLKVDRFYNWADLLTHHWTRVEGSRRFMSVGFERR